jgi:hypothetical protein
MTCTDASARIPPHVMVQFGDGVHSFLLPTGATLMELADRVDNLAAMHDCAPIAIHVEFDTYNSRPSTNVAWHNARH